MSVDTYTTKSGRRFAFTLGIAFAVLAALSYWRGRHLPPQILGALAVIAFAGGIAVPSKLGPVEKAWMQLAHAISKVTTPIFMGIVYFVILTPIGIIRRIAGGNPLVHRSSDDSYWIKRTSVDADARRRRMERQF